MASDYMLSLTNLANGAEIVYVHNIGVAELHIRGAVSQ